MLGHFAFHLHSTWSYDGRYSLRELAERFRSRGYAGMIVSEHDQGFNPARFEAYRQECLGLSERGFVVVPAMEYSDADNRVHVVVVGPDVFLGEARPTLSLLEDARARDAYCILAHPTRRLAWQLVTPRMRSLLSGVEVWNRKTDGIGPSREGLDLQQETSLPPFFAHDFHTARQQFPFSMRLELSEPTPEAVVAALHAGRHAPCLFRRPTTLAWLHRRQGWLRTVERVRRTLARLTRPRLRRSSLANV
jgi:hypothetical protein